MAKKNQTVETKASVASFIKKINDEKRRKDFSAMVDLFKKNTKLEPKMWGPAIVGFGSYHYKYESGREGDAPLTGLASRANDMTLYMGKDFENAKELYSKLGKHKLSGGCLHIKKLEDVDTKVLATMIKNCVAHKMKTGEC